MFNDAANADVGYCGYVCDVVFVDDCIVVVVVIVGYVGLVDTNSDYNGIYIVVVISDDVTVIIII